MSARAATSLTALILASIFGTACFPEVTAIARAKRTADFPSTWDEEGAGSTPPGVAAARVSADPAAPSTVPRIWLVSVGVSTYKEAAISLRYADRDARAIDALFASEAGGSVPAERRALLVNEQATRAAVLTALTAIAKRTAPDDLLVVFLAMHGFPDAGGDLYFLTHDTDPMRLIGTGLPHRDLEYSLARAPATRVVVLADACHAGAAGFSAGRRGLELAETNRLVGALADSKPGIAVLTASSAQESSMEDARWGNGHGVFTHFVIEGLKGQADTNDDHLITIRELFEFVYSRVSADTNGVQHPELKGTFDNKLPLSSRVK